MWKHIVGSILGLLVSSLGIVYLSTHYKIEWWHDWVVSVLLFAAIGFVSWLFTVIAVMLD